MVKLTFGSDSDDRGTRRQSIEQRDFIPNPVIFVKRTAIEFLQILFSEESNTRFLYDEDDSKSMIQITDLHAVDFTQISLRPAIVCIRGPVSWQGMGIGQNAMETRNVRSGTYVQNDLLQASLAFNVFGREGVEVEEIANTIFTCFKFYRPILQQYGYFTIKSLNMGAESLIDQDGSNDNTTMIPIYVQVMTQERVSLRDTAGRTLRQIITSIEYC